MADVFTRVVKVGGSLLDDATLGPRLQAWLTAQPPARSVLVVGGGRFVDAIRDADRLHGLGDGAAHWLSIHAMQTTARLVAALLPSASFVCRVQGIDREQSGVSILDVLELLEADQGATDELPASWDVTSDTIAARVARAVGASELVLLKSSLPAAGPVNAMWLADTGYVDRAFPKAMSALRARTVVRCVDFRSSNFAEESLGS